MCLSARACSCTCICQRVCELVHVRVQVCMGVCMFKCACIYNVYVLCVWVWMRVCMCVSVCTLKKAVVEHMPYALHVCCGIWKLAPLLSWQLCDRQTDDESKHRRWSRQAGWQSDGPRTPKLTLPLPQHSFISSPSYKEEKDEHCSKIPCFHCILHSKAAWGNTVDYSAVTNAKLLITAFYIIKKKNIY